MLERIWSHALAEHVGQRVRVVGWLASVRNKGAIAFVVVRDGVGTVQAVVSGSVALGLETVIAVEGLVVAEPQLELHDVRIEVISAVTEQPPVLLSKKALDVPLPALLDHAMIANRHPARREVFRVAAAAMQAFRRALDREGFVEIQSPKLVGGATEGGANVFALPYFDTTAYLAQSPQLYKQVMVGVFERVYEVGPVFRAEPHATARHINQYTSLDVELGFIESHRDVMALVTRVIAEMMGGDVPAEIPAIDFLEARARIAAALGARHAEEPDLAPEGERWLGGWAQETYGSDWLFVTGYPLAKRPFYTHPDPERPAQSRSFDLLYRGTELVTGGQRLHRHEDYLAALATRGIAAAPLARYLDAFRFGMPPHGGFAIGLERFVMQRLGLPNIRLATLFPRDLARLAP